MSVLATYWSAARASNAVPGFYVRSPLLSPGYDVRSRIADPLFIDPENGNFGLRPGSPALESGFIPLPDGLNRC